MNKSVQEQGVGEAFAIIHFISFFFSPHPPLDCEFLNGGDWTSCLMLSTLPGTVGVLKMLDE